MIHCNICGHSWDKECGACHGGFSKKYVGDLRAKLAEARAEIEKYKVGKVAPADYYSMAEAEEKLCKELAEARAEIEHWKGECSDLVRMAHEMRAEIDYFQTLIDLQHKRTVEANKLWQQAHNQPDAWPDLGKLIEWLLLRLKNQEAIIEANRATVKAKDAQIESMKCCQNCDNLGGRASRCGDCVRLIFVPDADSVDNWAPIKEGKKP
jgi:hypothetical protein